MSRGSLWPRRTVRQVQVSGPGSVNVQAGRDVVRAGGRPLGETVAEALNPPGGSHARPEVLAAAVRRIADYVASLACSCGPGAVAGESAQCGRCAALGQVNRKPVRRG